MSRENLTTPSNISVLLKYLSSGTSTGDIITWSGTRWESNSLYLFPINIEYTSTNAFAVSDIVTINSVDPTVEINANINAYENVDFKSSTSLITDNSLLSLAIGNHTDLLDIGFYGKYINGGTYYTGLFRDASDGIFKVGTTTSTPGLTLESITLGDLAVNSLVATGLSGTLSTGSQPNITVLGGLTTIGAFNSVLNATTGLLSNATTDNLTQGSNLYASTTNIQGAFSGTSGISYTSGVLSLDTSVSPSFTSATLSGLTASRFLATNGSKGLISRDLTNMIAGTNNQVSTASNGSGGVILSTPQNLNTGATLQFSSLGIGTIAGTSGTLTLAGSSSGNIIISGGSAPSSYSFTFPVLQGNNGQILTSNGGSALTWNTRGLQIYAENTTSATSLGNGSVTGWATRPLNTIGSGNMDSIHTSLSSNIITIQAGTYYINISAPTYASFKNQLRLYNVSNSSVVTYGTCEYSDAARGYSGRSFLQTYITIASATQYRVEHYVEVTNALVFGVQNGQGTEVYCQVVIQKIL